MAVIFFYVNQLLRKNWGITVRWFLLPFFLMLSACIHTENYAVPSAKLHVNELNAYALSGSGYRIRLQDSYPIGRASVVYVSAEDALLATKLSTALRRYFAVQSLPVNTLPKAGFLFRIEQLLSCKQQSLSCESRQLHDQIAIANHKDRYMPRHHRFKITVLDLHSEKTIEVIHITTRRAFIARDNSSARLLDHALIRLTKQLSESAT